VIVRNKLSIVIIYEKMGYLRSEIKKRDDDLYEVKLFYSHYVFFERCEHTCKKTIEDCEKWLLEKRCTNLDIIEKKSLKDEKEWPVLKNTKKEKDHCIQQGKNHKL
jgi:hypothetical protein